MFSSKFSDIISIADITKSDIEDIFKTASILEQTPDEQKSKILKHKTVGLLFFEPSTRTRLSFELAASKLGAHTIGFSGSFGTSVEKGESLIDTIRTIERYTDIIVIRHPFMGAARLAAQISSKPIINAGDGANQHPTQTLLDLYMIQKTYKRIDGLRIGIVGDLKYGRTVHSLAYALMHYNVEIVFISPPQIRIPSHILRKIRSSVLAYEDELLLPWIDKLDLLYITRIQKERFSDPLEYEKIKNIYKITSDIIKDKKVKIMHPLPRVNEIASDVDKLPNAIYFDQVECGVYIREAIFALLKL